MSRPTAVSSREIFETLESEILTLKLKPGELLSENALCERFGVSRSPIRSVLQELRLCGLVTIEPYRGTYVTRMDLDIINQIIYQRFAVETFILEDFCEAVDELEIQRLQYKHRQMAELVERDSFKASDFFQLDSQLHQTWFEATRKGYLWQCIQKSDRHYTRFRMLDIVRLGAQAYSQIVEEHALLIGALEKKEVPAFRPILKKHLFGGVSRLGDLLLGELSGYFVHAG